MEGGGLWADWFMHERLSQTRYLPTVGIRWPCEGHYLLGQQGLQEVQGSSTVENKRMIHTVPNLPDKFCLLAHSISSSLDVHFFPLRVSVSPTSLAWPVLSHLLHLDKP